MYFVKYGDTYIHDPRIGLNLSSATLEKEDNRSSNFIFEMPITNELYSTLKIKDRDHLITVFSDDQILFRGEIVSIQQNFYLTRTITCRDELAYLNDSLVRPFSTTDTTAKRLAPYSIDKFFEFLISEHNNQVESEKRFTIGLNYGSTISSVNYVDYSDSSYSPTGSILKDAILDSIGGHLRLDYTEDGRIISLLDEYSSESTQIIDFGVNLLDYAQIVDATGIVTFVVPIGPSVIDYKDEDQKSYDMTIDKSMVDIFKRNLEYDQEILKEAIDYRDNLGPDATEEERKQAEEAVVEAQESVDKSTKIVSDSELNTKDSYLGSGYFKQNDMIYLKDAVDKYGWIGTTTSVDNAEYISDLILDSISTLKTYSNPILTIDVKALDLSLIDSNYDPIKLGQKVRIRSVPHNIDTFMQCTKVTYDLLKPENNSFTLGSIQKTFTDSSNDTDSEINSLNKKIRNLERIIRKE